MTKYAPAKTGDYPSDIPHCTCCKKYLKDNKHNSLHLARKDVRIFVLEQICELLEAQSSPGVSLLENCSLLRPDTPAYFRAKQRLFM